MNPVDEFIKEAGGLWDAFKRGVTGGGAASTVGEAMMQGLGQALPGAVIGTGLAAGAAGTSVGIGAIKGRITKARNYKSMLSADPSLKKFDAGQVQMVYNSLHSQAPSMAGDPLIAGSFVRRTLEMSPESGPFVDPQTVKLLSEAQRNVSTARSSRGGIGELFRPTTITPMNLDPSDEAGRSLRERQFGEQMAQRESQFKKQFRQRGDQFSKQRTQQQKQFDAQMRMKEEQMARQQQQFKDTFGQKDTHHQEKLYRK